MVRVRLMIMFCVLLLAMRCMAADAQEIFPTELDSAVIAQEDTIIAKKVSKRPSFVARCINGVSNFLM